jgi:acyl carrier protein
VPCSQTRTSTVRRPDRVSDPNPGGITMTELSVPTRSKKDVEQRLTEMVGSRLGVPASDVDVTQFFDDFGLDSTEALVLAGELESWIGMELPTTALWYHPTIEDLAAFIAEELTSSASPV